MIRHLVGVKDYQHGEWVGEPGKARVLEVLGVSQGRGLGQRQHRGGAVETTLPVCGRGQGQVPGVAELRGRCRLLEDLSSGACQLATSGAPRPHLAPDYP